MFTISDGMIDIKINNDFLDLYPNTQISFQLNSPAFFGATADIVQGSYTFPINLPDTPHNQCLTDYPSRLDNAAKLCFDKPVEIYWCGNILFSGKGAIKVASDKQIQLSVIIASLQELKEKTVQQTINDVRILGADITEPSMLSHAFETANTPQDFDYVFYPVRNTCFHVEDNDPQTVESDWQNYWNFNVGWFTENPSQSAAMPFLKLRYIYDKIFEACGITYENLFQTDAELNLLTVYNNYSIYTESGTWNTVLSLRDHAPQQKANEFLKAINQMFCLALFSDGFRQNSKVRLVPLRTIIRRPYKYDWTEKAQCEYSKSCIDDAYESLCFASTDDKLEEGDKRLEDYVILNPFVGQVYTQTWNDVPLSGFALKYIEETDGIVQAEGAFDPINFSLIYNKFNLLNKRYLCHLKENATGVLDVGSKLDVKAAPLFTYFVDPDTGVPFPFTTERPNKYPWIEFEGTYYYQRDNFAPAPPLKLTFYRGFEDSNEIANLGPYPYANSHEYDNDGNDVYNYSLSWQGDKGLHAVWWRDWLSAMQNANLVTRDICLDFVDLVNFSFEDKVRIENMDYLVKSLKVTLTMQGIKPATAELVSIRHT